MDMEAYAESESIGIDFIKSQTNKIGVILSGGIMSPTKEGLMKPKFMVQINAKNKYWTMNKTSAKLFVEKLGKESDQWIGKKVLYSIGFVNGKECVLGTPIE